MRLSFPQRGFGRIPWMVWICTRRGAWCQGSPGTAIQGSWGIPETLEARREAGVAQRCPVQLAPHGWGLSAESPVCH